ncbi:M16 family metallopeptidase [Streptomyces sp. 8N706]|uniref:M16 family metallopeptidase n=1 Tax=Streptomyces sp. 8N706 TaxID=3457416 RepID=UPI003FD0DD91
MTVTPTRPPDLYTAQVGGIAATAVRLSTVPLVEVRLRLPMPMPGPRAVAAAEVAAEVLFGHTAPTGRALVRHGGYLVAAADQDHLCVAATAPAAALATLLREIGAALAGRAADEAAVRSVTRELAAASRASEDDPDVLATAVALRSAYGATSAYAYEWPGPALLSALEPEEVRAVCAGITVTGASAAVVGDIDPRTAVALVERFLAGVGGPSLPDRALPPAPSGPRNVALHRPGATQTTLRRVLVLPPDDGGLAAWRVCDLVFGGQPSSRLARSLREENGYAYIARSRLVRRLRRADLRVIADVGLPVTAPALTLLDEVTRGMADRVTDAERTAAGGFAATALMMSRGGQSDLAGLLSQELGLGRDWEAVDRDVRLLADVDGEELDRVARELAQGSWHTALVGDLDRIGGGGLPPLGGAGWDLGGVS